MLASGWIISCGSDSQEKRDAARDAPVDVLVKKDALPAADAPLTPDSVTMPDAPATVDGSRTPDAPATVDGSQTPDVLPTVDGPSVVDVGGAIEARAADQGPLIDVAGGDVPIDGPMSVDSNASEAGGIGPIPAPPRVVLFAAPTTIIAAAESHVVVYGQLQDKDGNPMIATIGSSAFAIKVTLSSSNNDVLTSAYPASDDRSKLIFDETSNPNNWDHTYFKATSNAGTVTISGSASGYIVVPTTVTTVAKGGSPAAVRVYALPAKIPAPAIPSRALVHLIDSLGVPTTDPSPLAVSITSDNQAVTKDVAVSMLSSSTWTIATLDVPGATGTATLTASATGLASGTATFTVLP